MHTSHLPNSPDLTESPSGSFRALEERNGVNPDERLLSDSRYERVRPPNSPPLVNFTVNSLVTEPGDTYKRFQEAGIIFTSDSHYGKVKTPPTYSVEKQLAMLKALERAGFIREGSHPEAEICFNISLGILSGKAVNIETASDKVFLLQLFEELYGLGKHVETLDDEMEPNVEITPIKNGLFTEVALHIKQMPINAEFPIAVKNMKMLFYMWTCHLKLSQKLRTTPEETTLANIWTILKNNVQEVMGSMDRNTELKRTRLSVRYTNTKVQGFLRDKKHIPESMLAQDIKDILEGRITEDQVKQRLNNPAT